MHSLLIHVAPFAIIAAFIVVSYVWSKSAPVVFKLIRVVGLAVSALAVDLIALITR